jgi:threonine/homoserine/homoserine lactone efflux protein
MSSIIYFYICSYFIGFLLCIPIGPVNLEIFHTSLKKHYPQAVSIAIGGALGDALWALFGFFGVSPFRTSHYNVEAIFVFITSIILLVLGLFALKDAKFIQKKEEEIVVKIKRKRWSFLKGLSLVLINPLGIISWVVCLKFLDQFNIYIPMKLNYEILFFIVVALGASSYFLLIVFITNKMKHVFNPERTAKITKFLGYLLISLSVLFLYHSISTFFFTK